MMLSPPYPSPPQCELSGPQILNRVTTVSVLNGYLLRKHKRWKIQKKTALFREEVKTDNSLALKY